MPILDEIKKIAKDDADLSGIEKMLGDLDPLKNIQSKEDALSFIDRNQTFKSALDAETSKRVENALSKFKEEKLPELISEATKPKDETPEQKRIRELEERVAKADAREKMLERQKQFRGKAKELGFSEDIAAELAGFGDDAGNLVDKLAEYQKSTINSAVEAEIKKRFGEGAQPKQADESKDDFDLDKKMSGFSFL